MENLNLRIFRRTLGDITLLWNIKALTRNQIEHINIAAMIDNESKNLIFKVSEQQISLDKEITVPDATAMIIIDHETNKLNPSSDYQLMLSFGLGVEKRTYGLYIYAFGILPTLEKDDKRSNEHIYGWSAEDRKWAKFPLIKLVDGSYAVPVKVIK